ncbi:SLBB domain-containing protein, partial [bacterium]|nr:SLBB domain-containing protein [bacterium]
MAQLLKSRVFALSIYLAVFVLSNSVQAQVLPPNFTLEQLSPQQRAELLRRLQQSGVTFPPAQGISEQMQLPEYLIPQADTTRGITRVDTTQFYVESAFDFGLVAGELSSKAKLELYGRRLFQLAPETFEPSTYGPVGSDYQLGPGDEIIVTVWGVYQYVYELSINREGYVLVPGVGQVVLAYLTLEQAKQRLYQYMTPFLQALNFEREGATAFLDVSLGKLRAIKVFVLGDALRPGAYTLSSVSTIFTALYAAGGPSNLGSLRVIRLIRGSREIARLDGYDNLLRGDPSNDVRLEDNDIVFINPLGPKVMVQGRVQRPAVYELKSGDTLKDIIDASGGITASARLDRSQIARIL